MPQPSDAVEQRSGVLHVFVAFDWGDEIKLAEARRLVQGVSHALPRRPRTPASIEYRPLPLRIALPPMRLEIPEIGKVNVDGELTLFDFGAVSVACQIPFSLSPAALARLAGLMALTTPVVATARQAIEPFYQKLLPAIDDASWSELCEEYFVFQLEPWAAEPPPALRTGPSAAWLAGLVRLEPTAFSVDEQAEALRQHLSYTPDDLFVADWPAAVLIDRDCEETLEVIEFANLQLLEYRHIDQRVDDNLVTAANLLHNLRQSALPFWRTHAKPMRILGDLRMEANGLFERTGNVLKLVGDQYLARVYRLLERRFHLTRWETNIARKLEVLDETYRTLADQGATFRAEFLEWVIILLIMVEVVMSLLKH